MFSFPDLVLASASRARAELLRGAGLSFKIIPAEIDERAYPEDALTLAREKALAVSQQHKGALVIGADQILQFEGKVLHKAKTADEALDKLRALSGRTHRLVSGAAVARDGEILWSDVAQADMTMRVLDEDFLSLYKAAAGDALTSCAGGYALEGAGAWLFEKVEGEHSTVLGLPLLPLLGFLKTLYGGSL